jgi:hypothetical protein
MPVVYPKFTGAALEVEQDEADVLAAQGLLLDGPIPDEDRLPKRVVVTPVFTGQPIEVGADEARLLAEQGLLVAPEPEPEPVVEKPASKAAEKTPDPSPKEK